MAETLLFGQLCYHVCVAAAADAPVAEEGRHSTGVVTSQLHQKLSPPQIQWSSARPAISMVLMSCAAFPPHQHLEYYETCDFDDSYAELPNDRADLERLDGSSSPRRTLRFCFEATDRLRPAALHAATSVASSCAAVEA